jgi:hypothetical protein
MLLVVNIEHLDRELKNIAAQVSNPAGQLWIMAVPKEYLLNLGENPDDADLVQNFEEFTRNREKRSLEDMPEPLPAWAEKALQTGYPIYVFWPPQLNRVPVWKKIDKIAAWFGCAAPADLNYAVLSFAEAARKAEEWAAKVGYAN